MDAMKDLASGNFARRIEHEDAWRPKEIREFRDTFNRTAEQLEGLIMPCNYEEADIDIEQEFGDIKTLSYENFINDYVFNSWKKETKTELAWAI